MRLRTRSVELNIYIWGRSRRAYPPPACVRFVHTHTHTPPRLLSVVCVWSDPFSIVVLLHTLTCSCSDDDAPLTCNMNSLKHEIRCCYFACPRAWGHRASQKNNNTRGRRRRQRARAPALRALLATSQTKLLLPHTLCALHPATPNTAKATCASARQTARAGRRAGRT